MGKFSRLIVVGVALACLSKLQRSTFVTPPLRSVALPAAATAAVTVSGIPALADEIGDAAKQFSKVAYPFLKDIDWNSQLALTKPGKASAAEWTKAIAKAIDMGASMDSKLLKAGVEAHHVAIQAVDKKGLTTQQDFEKIIASIGRMIASAPESKTMDVYDSFSKLVSPEVPKYLLKSVKEADAIAAYDGLMEFKNVVKSHPITPAVIPELSSKVSIPVSVAANKLSAAAYPFLKEVNWDSDLPLKPLGKATPQEILTAIDKALVMGAAMNGGALQEAALAHVKAIARMDGKGVTTQADFAAINTGLGKAIATAPPPAVMDVYKAFSKVVSPDVPKNLIKTVKADDAKAAYAALLEFKDAVKAAHFAM